MEKKFAIARITKPFGMKGGVRLAPLSRYCDDYISDRPIYLGDTENSNKKVELLEKMATGKYVRCVFKEINTRSKAEAVNGKYVYVEVTSDDKINQISTDLISYAVVTDTGDFVGELAEILWLPVNDIYVIRNGDREILIPVIPEVVKSISDANRIIEITPMDGLID